MLTFFGIPLLPFWILGVPFVAAIVSFLRLPSQRDLAPRHRQHDPAL